MHTRSVLAVITLILLSAVPALATTYVVRPDGTGDFPTIQAAIDATFDADTILLTDGTFSGDGNRDLDYGGRAITIESQGGDPAACVIDCQGTPADHHRGVAFRSGETANAVLRGVTITGGYMEASDPLYDGVGGGILLRDGSSPTIERVIIAECTAMAGGGMFIVNEAQPSLSECEFVGNSAWWGSGGAISSIMFDGTVSDCVFRENSANQAGGAFACASGEPLVERCFFVDNEVAYDGGGFECIDAAPDVRHCTFAGNQAGSNGGAAYASMSSDLTIFGCTLVDNAGAWAGGLGAMATGTLDIRNTIIAFSRTGTAVHCEPDADVTISCTDVYGNQGGDYVDCITGQDGVNGNKHSDPLFCDPGGYDWSLHADSECAPLNSHGCVLIGAWPVGCGTSGVAGSSPPAPALVLRVRPNPLRTDGRIEWEVAGSPVTSVKLFDATGRLLLTRTPAGAEGLAWRDLVSEGPLPSGIYFLELTDGLGRTAATRVAVMR